MSNFTARDWSMQYESVKKRMQVIRTTAYQVPPEEVKSSLVRSFIY
jgi:hypothetical protein